MPAAVGAGTSLSSVKYGDKLVGGCAAGEPSGGWREAQVISEATPV